MGKEEELKKEVRLPSSEKEIIKALEKFSKAAEDFNSCFKKARHLDESEFHKQVTI